MPTLCSCFGTSYVHLKHMTSPASEMVKGGQRPGENTPTPKGALCT